MPETQPQPLRAVPDDTAADIKPVHATPAHEPLRPVLPDWLRSRENLRAAARRRARYDLHRAAYHGTRSPAYAAKGNNTIPAGTSVWITTSRIPTTPPGGVTGTGPAGPSDQATPYWPQMTDVQAARS